MATSKNAKSNGKLNTKALNGAANDLQRFFKNQLQEAQKRFNGIEGDAEKALKDLMARGKASRKELQALVNKVNEAELNPFDTAAMKDFTKRAEKASRELSKRAEQAGNDLRKRLDTLQARLVRASGVATQQQVKELKGELNRLSKKIDALVGTKKTQKTDATA